MGAGLTGREMFHQCLVVTVSYTVPEEVGTVIMFVHGMWK
jgi:hypothetical protein